jgi:hypothetical protein
VQDHFYRIAQDIDRKLLTSAHEWTDSFRANLAQYPVNLRFPAPDHFPSQFAPVIESTINEVERIQAQL